MRHWMHSTAPVFFSSAPRAGGSVEYLDHQNLFEGTFAAAPRRRVGISSSLRRESSPLPFFGKQLFFALPLEPDGRECTYTATRMHCNHSKPETPPWERAEKGCYQPGFSSY